MAELDSLDSVLGDDVDTEQDEKQLDQQQEDDNDTSGEEQEEAKATPAEDAKPTDKPAPDKKSDEDAEEPWTKAAVQDERRKRQALERELAEIKARLNPDAAPKQPARPDIFEDQDGAFKHLESTLETRMIVSKVELSQELMREKHADYDEMEEQFVDLVKADPSLIQKMRAAALPAKFVYDHVKKHQQLQEMQDVDGYKAKVKAELRAELLAELEAERAAEEEAETPATPRTPHPPQLVNRRSADKQPVGHESLEEIFGGR